MTNPKKYYSIIDQFKAIEHKDNEENKTLCCLITAIITLKKVMQLNDQMIQK